MLLSGFNITEILFRIPAVLIAISIHETAHGYVAYKLGDPTAKNMGRLSLNPLDHLDIMGVICMLLFGFGWAKPVPVNPLYFKNRKQGMSLVGLAGPMSNLFMALISALLLGVFFGFGLHALESIFVDFLLNVLSAIMALNVGLAVFNLIPIPPLDGSKILAVVLPDKAYYNLMRYERYAMPILMILLFFNILTPVLGFISGKIYDFLFDFINIIAGLF